MRFRPTCYHSPVFPQGATKAPSCLLEVVSRRMPTVAGRMGRALAGAANHGTNAGDSYSRVGDPPRAKIKARAVLRTSAQSKSWKHRSHGAHRLCPLVFRCAQRLRSASDTESKNTGDITIHPRSIPRTARGEHQGGRVKAASPPTLSNTSPDDLSIRVAADPPCSRHPSRSVAM